MKHVQCVLLKCMCAECTWHTLAVFFVYLYIYLSILYLPIIIIIQRYSYAVLYLYVVSNCKISIPVCMVPTTTTIDNFDGHGNRVCEKEEHIGCLHEDHHHHHRMHDINNNNSINAMTKQTTCSPIVHSISSIIVSSQLENCQTNKRKNKCDNIKWNSFPLHM